MSTGKKIRPNGTSNDPIADFLARIKNALNMRKKEVRIPYSKLKWQLAELFRNEGYVLNCEVVDEDIISRKSILITLKYVGERSVIEGMKKVSKPGLRKYTKSEYAPRVRSGLGISVLSTSKGLMTDRKARKEKIGGEIFCQVW